MSPILYYVAGILGLGLLIVVHESGHLLAARASGMRVVRFSIGFGPPLIRYQSKKSETLYQIALIPFLAYVQIAGMNPFEEIDPEDKGSYANASLFARVFAILAGPLANYVFASVLFFIYFAVGGIPKPASDATVEVLGKGAAVEAQMKSGDTITAVGGTPVSDWESMRKIVVKNANKPLVFDVTRGPKKEKLKLTITPQADKQTNEGRIGVTVFQSNVKVSMKEAALESLVTPYMVVKASLTSLARIITLQEKADLGGPVRIVSETSKAARDGWLSFTWFLGALSAYLGGFNALPFPALDGGRLAFLGYEAITRRKPNQRIEVMVHALGFAMLIALITVVTVSDTKRVISEHSDSPAASAAPKKAAP